MKDKIFCKFETKQVNTQYYQCPRGFKDCEKCPKLSPPSKKHRPVTAKKPKHLNRGKEQKQDLFSSLNRYPTHCLWRRHAETNKWIPEVVFVLEDSRILDSLIATFKIEANGDEVRGVEKFWQRVESFSEWKQGNRECLTQEEKEILMEAKDGSIEAIQKLVIANPKMIRLPFVGKVLEDLIRTIKFRDGKEFQEAKKLWKGFLPKRGNHRHVIKDEYLIKALRDIMENMGCTKEEAARILHCDDPSLCEEKLRKISVGPKDRKH